MQSRPRHLLHAVLRCGLCLAALWASPSWATPRVVASIVPIHSLVAAVMEEVGEPTLIVRGFQSPHTYQMRPSDAARINAADLVFWIGSSLETFLSRSLSALPANARVVELSALEGLLLLPNRAGGLLPGHGKQERPRRGAEPADHTDHRAALFDVHFWLDIGNAKRIVAAIAAELTSTDPDHANIYRRNEERLLRRLEQLDGALAKLLEPLGDRPYLVLHDAYQYLEHRYGLNAVGAVVVAPDRMPSAKHIRTLRARAEELGVVCIFREPQFERALLRTMVEDTDTRIGVLDPMGSEVAPGPNAYLQMMAMNAANLVDCLSD